MVLFSGFSVCIIRYIHIGSPLQAYRTSMWACWVLRVLVNVYSAAAVLLSSLFMSVRTFNVIASRFELLVVDWPRNLLHMHTIYFKCIIIYLFPLWNVSSMLCLCVMSYVKCKYVCLLILRDFSRGIQKYSSPKRLHKTQLYFYRIWYIDRQQCLIQINVLQTIFISSKSNRI